MTSYYDDVVFDKTFAGKLFEYYDRCQIFEDALFEQVNKICGIDIHKSAELGMEMFRFSDTTFDPYDNSMEIKGAKKDFVPPSNFDADIKALGFGCYWICYEDGSERYCTGPRRCKYLSVEAEWLEEVKNKAYHQCIAPFDDEGNHTHEFCHGYNGPIEVI